MEVIRGKDKLEHSESSARTEVDSVFMSARIFGGKTGERHNKDGTDMNIKSLSDHQVKICKESAQLNSDFLISVGDQLIGNSNVDGSNFSSNNISDDSPLQSLYCCDLENGNSVSVNAQDSDCRWWRSKKLEPALPISLKFKDVKYKVVVKDSTVKSSGSDEKCIVNGVTGWVDPGEVLAIMGPSGSGKTTLLNLLGGKIRCNYTGTITYNDQPYTKSLKRRIGFVMQDDVLFPHLTVKDTLTYAALLRLPGNLTVQQKKARVMDVIRDLRLERCQNTIVGGRFVRGISGGERKRVCIGNEIMLNPSLFFLDEPTSGLDSTTALIIIQMLHEIAKSGKTVVTTIHQPSSRLFNKFDKLILLGRGISLYFGQASNALLYFSSLGCSPLISMNPAEFLVDLANGNINEKSVVSHPGMPSPLHLHQYLVEEYATSITKSERTQKPVTIKGKADPHHVKEFRPTWWEQFSILFRRSFQERRYECLSCLRVTQVISCAIIVGLLWWRSDHGSISPNQRDDQAGVLFFLSVFWVFLPLFSAIFTFPQERLMLVKERSVDMYKLSAYFAARNTSDLPLELIMPIVFIVIVYLMAGLKLSFQAFSLTMLTVFLSIVGAQGLGLLIGAIFIDVKKATTVASITIMIFMLSGGFFIQKVPSFMSWTRYMSFNYHTYRLLLKIQYGSCEFTVVRGLRLDHDGRKEVGAIMAMVIAYRLLAYLFLRRIEQNKLC